MEVITGNIHVSNPNKIIYPEMNITKKQVVQYYNDIAPIMIEYLKDRPITVIRCHQGIGGECFFKKHPTTDKNYIHTVKVGQEEYFYISTVEELVYQAQMGTIEFHVWGCKANRLNNPDIMIFDLDPDEKMKIKRLREGVKYLKELLDQLNLKSYLKTSGGKGYHVVVPFKTNKNWDKFNEISSQISQILEEKYPQLFTTNMRKDKRDGKIFIDYLRNKKGATCVAPYSLRARKGATISMPLEWDELGKVKPDEVNIKNYKKFCKNDEKNNIFL